MNVVKEVREKTKKYHWLFQIVMVFTLSRLIIFGAAHIGNVMLPTDTGHWMPEEIHPFWAMWARWDSQWYKWIVEQGYWLRPGQMSNVAFFPMYPLLVDILSSTFGINIIIASIVISNTALLGAFLFLYKLALLEFVDKDSAYRTVFYLAFFPTSFFLSSMYTESLFLLCSVAVIYFARLRQWNLATLMGILASATRVVGVFTWGLVMWEWLRVHGWTLNQIHSQKAWLDLRRGIKQDWLELLIIGLIPLGLLSYMAFLKLNFGDSIAFASVQSAWNRENIGPFAVIANDLRYIFADGFNQHNTLSFLNIITFVGAIGLALGAWKRLGAGYSIYVLIMLVLPASSSSQSILRYVLVCFPIFMMLGEMGKNPKVDRYLSVGFASLLGLMTAIFVNWIFVA
ncbi:MAG: hypothetical protein GY755_16290 [Chloroflexi bacterium]|nr:hypothetical protein [Chloroflexota bacterium]